MEPLGPAREIRPHVAVAAHYVLDVVPLASGGYAVLTGGGIELLDATLVRHTMIPGERTDSVLVVLPGGRFLVHGTRMSWLYEGAVGGELAKVDLGGGMVTAVAVTESGFLAITTDGVLVDHAGTRRTVVPEGRCTHGGVAWRGGAVVAGYDGLAILAADGTVVAEATESLWKDPIALADAIAVPGHDDVVVFDGAAQLIARIPRKVGHDGLQAFRDGVIVEVYDQDADKTEVGYWQLADGGAALRWSVTVDELQRARVAGDRVVVGSLETDVRILDGDGHELAHLTTPQIMLDAAPFGDGIALNVRDSRDVLWWRPDAELAVLEHDVEATRLRSTPAGLVTTEDNIVYLWRTDDQGPEVVPIESDLPMNTPIVIAGTPVEIVGTGRFSLRGRTLAGHPWSLKRGATWRPMTTRDEAGRLLERLVERTFDGALPAIPDDTMIDQVAAKLGQLPLADTVDLHGRAMFAASTLDPETRKRAGWARDRFFAELGAAVGARGRLLRAAVKVRKLKLVPPRPVPGYDYLGTFTTSGNLTVSDPCHVGKKVNPALGFSLSLKVAGLDGVWHVFVRDHAKELVTIHDDGFEVYASEVIGSIGVDSGTAGVFDKKCPQRDDDAPFEEGTVSALGAVAWTGGDSIFPVFAGNLRGRVAKLRLHFEGKEPEVDRSAARPAAAARPYSASAKFALGETIQHVKFGAGSVTRVGTDGKIDVRFADGMRTLVHARK